MDTDGHGWTRIRSAAEPQPKAGEINRGTRGILGKQTPPRFAPCVFRVLHGLWLSRRFVAACEQFPLLEDRVQSFELGVHSLGEGSAAGFEFLGPLGGLGRAGCGLVELDQKPNDVLQTGLAVVRALRLADLQSLAGLQ